jgi:hypothetical protein
LVKLIKQDINNFQLAANSSHPYAVKKHLLGQAPHMDLEEDKIIREKYAKHWCQVEI